jgi:hypothetical protein
MRKTKPNRLPAWLTNLIGPVYLDFIAPEPLEVAIRLLKEEETTGVFRLERLSVDLIPQDGDTFRFTVTLRAYKKTALVAQGLLKRWDEETTHCTVHIRAARQVYLLYLAVLIALLPWVSFSLRNLWAILIFIILFAGTIVLNSHFAQRNALELAHRIESVLNP